MTSIQELFDNWQKYGFLASGRLVPFKKLFVSASWHPDLSKTIVFEIDHQNKMLFKLNDQGELCTVSIDPPHAECQIGNVVEVE